MRKIKTTWIKYRWLLLYRKLKKGKIKSQEYCRKRKIFERAIWKLERPFFKAL